MSTRVGKKGNVTIYDIASELGIGKTTVSLVLNGRGNISPATRAAVLKKARHYGFQLNPHAQRLSQGRCDKSIFLFIENLHPGTGTERAALIQRRLREYGFDIPIYTYGIGPSGNSAELMTSLCRQRPVAIIYSGQFDPTVTAELQRYHESGGFAVCFSDAVQPTFDTVTYDYGDALDRALRHLLGIGHRQIGFYCTQPDDRYMAGLRRIFAEGALSRNNLQIIDGPSQEAGGVYLAEQFLALNIRPSGLCVVNDATATVFINNILRAGLQVPRDVSIIGFDDTIQARNCIVPLTTVRQPVEQIANAVVDMVLDRIEGNHCGGPRHQPFQGEVIYRESTTANKDSREKGDVNGTGEVIDRERTAVHKESS